MIGKDLLHRFRRKPVRKRYMGDYRLFWWFIADNVDRTSPRGLL